MTTTPTPTPTLRDWLLMLAGNHRAPEYPGKLEEIAALNPSTKELDMAQEGARGLVGADRPITPGLVALRQDDHSLVALALALDLRARALTVALEADHGPRLPSEEHLHNLHEVAQVVARGADGRRSLDGLPVVTRAARALSVIAPLAPHPPAPEEAKKPVSIPQLPSSAQLAKATGATPKRLVLLAGLVGGIVAALLVPWVLQAMQVPPEPSTADYQEVLPDVVDQYLEGDVMVFTVNETWTGVDPWERDHQVAELLEATGPLLYDKIEVRRPDGRRLATVYLDEEVDWHGDLEGPPL